MKINTQKSFQHLAFNSFGYTLGSGVARPYDNSVFNFLKKNAMVEHLIFKIYI